MKIIDITGKNTRIVLVEPEYIHKCGDCSFFPICGNHGVVNQDSVACETFF